MWCDFFILFYKSFMLSIYKFFAEKEYLLQKDTIPILYSLRQRYIETIEIYRVMWGFVVRIWDLSLKVLQDLYWFQLY